MKSTTAAAALAVGLSLTALPTVAHSQSIMAFGSCIGDSLTIGNGGGQEISYISGKYVIEQYGYVKAGEWFTSTALSTFFAEIVPAHDWRKAVIFRDGYEPLCGPDKRIRIIRLDHCIIGRVDYGALCAVNMKPTETFATDLQVVYQPQ